MGKKSNKKKQAKAEAVAPPVPSGAPDEPGSGGGDPGQGSAARPFVLAMWAALGVAAGVASYLFYGFMMKTYGPAAYESVCNFGASFNCDKINTSVYGKIGGIPITVFAVPFYAALAVLARQILNGGEVGGGALRLVTLGSGAAVAYGLFLLYVMAFVEQTFCIFCLTMDACAVVVFIAALLLGRKIEGKGALSAPLRPAVVTGVVALALGLGVHSVMKSSLEDALIQETDKGFDASAPAQVVSTPGGSGKLPEGGDPTKGYKIDERHFYVPVRAEDASIGPNDAKVTVVEFADFQCGYCKKLFYSLTPIKKKYKDQVRFVFKHFPMNTDCNDSIKNNRHRYACKASVAAECGRRQGKFWEMHDLLFKNQHKLKRKDLDYYAGQVGLEPGEFRRCMNDPSVIGHIKKDIATASSIEISGTPRTYINGRYLRGALPQRTLEHVIEQELGRRAPNERPQPVAKPKAPSAADAEAAPSQVAIDHGKAFSIDTFEASLDGSGRALSLHGVEPANLTWYEAKAACEASGKRLCSTYEWVTACQGQAAVDDDNNGSFADDYVEGNQFPYADYYEPRWCLDTEDRTAGKPATTGSKPRCVTPTGIYDLGGNVAEWAGSTEQQAVLLGGNYKSKDKSGCFRPNSTFGPGHKNISIGFRCCSDEAVTNPSVEAVAAAAPNGLEGRKLKAFEGQLLDGSTLRSADLRGKVVYLSFFASWCGPCRRELPELNLLQDKYADRGFQVLGVGVDTVAKKSEIFAKKAGVKYPVVLDPKSEILGMFDVKSMPTTYIVDKKGVIRHTQVGFGEKTLSEVSVVIEDLL